MWRVLALLSFVGLSAAQRAGGYGAGAGSYEEELLRRQYEFQQQQRLRQMQQQQMQKQQMAQAQAQQQAVRQAQYEASQRDAYIAAQQRDEAQQRARGSGGYASGTKPMSTKDKKKAQKQQAEAAKRRQKEVEARQKAFLAAQKKAGRGGGSRRAVSERSGPLSFIFSVKGVALTGVAGYLFVAQRALMASALSMLLKYPLLLLKMLIYRVIKLRSGPSTLPGGTY